MPAPNRILLVRLSHLGDVIHALPVFHALRAAHPTARIAWVVQPEFAEVLEGLPGLDQRIPFERKGGAAAWLELRTRLSAFGADLTVDAQGNWKSAMVTLTSGAPRRCGLHPADWRERLGALVLNEHAPRCTRGPHAVDRMLTLAGHLAPGNRTYAAARWLPVADTLLDAGRAALDSRLPGTEPPRLVALGTPGDPRAWPEDRVAELLAHCAAANQPTLVLSGPAEEESGARLATRVPSPLISHWVGQRGLPELIGLFAAAAERGGRLLANDSGPAHLAAAVGLPVLCLAGPQDAARTGPWPPPGAASPHRVLRADPEPACAPCFARSCAHPEGLICMEMLSAAKVADELMRPAPGSA